MSTAEEVRAALVGRWQFCSGGEEWLTWAPADTVGVEFTPPNGTALDGGAGGAGRVDSGSADANAPYAAEVAPGVETTATSERRRIMARR